MTDYANKAFLRWLFQPYNSRGSPCRCRPRPTGSPMPSASTNSPTARAPRSASVEFADWMSSAASASRSKIAHFKLQDFCFIWSIEGDQIPLSRWYEWCTGRGHIFAICDRTYQVISWLGATLVHILKLSWCMQCTKPCGNITKLSFPFKGWVSEELRIRPFQTCM